jgi:hypothetical protein
LREDEAASKDLDNIQQDGVNHISYDKQDLDKSYLKGSPDGEVFENSFEEDHVLETSVTENGCEVSKSEQSSPQIKSPPSDEFNNLDAHETSDSIPNAVQQADSSHATGKPARTPALHYSIHKSQNSIFSDLRNRVETDIVTNRSQQAGGAESRSSALKITAFVTGPTRSGAGGESPTSVATIAAAGRDPEKELQREQGQNALPLPYHTQADRKRALCGSSAFFAPEPFPASLCNPGCRKAASCQRVFLSGCEMLGGISPASKAPARRHAPSRTRLPKSP